MTATASNARQDAIGKFFALHRADLARVVGHGARNIGREAIEDACGFAWLRLISRPDVRLDRGGFSWPAKVAIQEAWRAHRERRMRDAIPCGMFVSERVGYGELSDPVGPAVDPLDRILDAELHRERIARFAQLKPRERRDLLLKASRRPCGRCARGAR